MNQIQQIRIIIEHTEGGSTEMIAKRGCPDRGDLACDEASVMLLAFKGTLEDPNMTIPARMKDQPYLIYRGTIEVKKFNPNFGNDRECSCGHTYYRHFDTHDNMEPVGCKYCKCMEFTLPPSSVDCEPTEHYPYWNKLICKCGSTMSVILVKSNDTKAVLVCQNANCERFEVESKHIVMKGCIQS